jgi:hypothetical protein
MLVGGWLVVPPDRQCRSHKTLFRDPSGGYALNYALAQPYHSRQHPSHPPSPHSLEWLRHCLGSLRNSSSILPQQPKSAPASQSTTASFSLHGAAPAATRTCTTRPLTATFGPPLMISTEGTPQSAPLSRPTGAPSGPRVEDVRALRAFGSLTIMDKSGRNGRGPTLRAARDRLWLLLGGMCLLLPGERGPMRQCGMPVSMDRCGPSSALFRLPQPLALVLPRPS